MAIKIPISSFARPSKIYPNSFFFVSNIPSGNTGGEEKKGEASFWRRENVFFLQKRGGGGIAFISYCKLHLKSNYATP
jgi:hypothetical protein